MFTPTDGRGAPASDFLGPNPVYWYGIPNHSAVTFSLAGLAAAANVGTATAVVSMHAINYATAGTAASLAGTRFGSASGHSIFSPPVAGPGYSGRKWEMCATFAKKDALSNCRRFFGLWSPGTSIANTNPPALAGNSIGVAEIDGSSNWQLILNGLRNGDGENLTVDTGVPITNAEVVTARLRFSPLPSIGNANEGGVLVEWQIKTSLGVLISDSINWSVARDFVKTAPRAYVSNNANTASAAFDYFGVIIGAECLDAFQELTV